MQTPDERVVGGLRCGEVLERLSDFVDGDIDSATRARIEEHLRGCDWCERFGNRFTGIVGALRRELRVMPDDGGVAARLRESVTKATKA